MIETQEYEFQFERRRYGGRHTYTWAYVLHGGEWLLMGDPWPGVNWPRKELQRVAAETIKYHEAKKDDPWHNRWKEPEQGAAQ